MRRRLDPTSPFDVLEAAFDALTTGRTPLVLDGTRVPGLPDRMIPLGELKSLLLHPATGYPARDTAVNQLLARARAEGGAAAIGLAGLLLPGLRRAAWPLCQGCPDKADDIQAEILTGLIAAVADLTPGGSRPAARLTWAALRSAERLLRAERGERARPAPLPTSMEPPAQHRHPDFVLDEAVAAGVICAQDAELIGATRLGECDLHTAAERAGLGYYATRKRRFRAEAGLVAWLTSRRQGFVPEAPSNPGSSVGGRPRLDRCPDRRSGVRQPTTTPRR